MQPHIFSFTNFDKSMPCYGWCYCQNVFHLVASFALRIRRCENSFHFRFWYLFENFINICSKLTVFPILTIQQAVCCSSLLLVVRDNEGKISQLSFFVQNLANFLDPSAPLRISTLFCGFQPLFESDSEPILEQQGSSCECQEWIFYCFQ